MKNWKITQYNLSKNVCFTFSACFVFCYCLITPSILCSVLIFYWKHISIKTDYTNYCRKTIPCASDCKRYLFILYHIISLSIFVLSRLRFINWTHVQLYLKVPNHIYVLKWPNIHCLIYFGFINPLMHNIPKWSDIL